MRKLYVLLEDIRDNIAPLIKGYGLDAVYRATMYSIVYAALTKSCSDYCLLTFLEKKIPRSLIALARGKLHYLFLELLDLLDSLIDSRKAAIVEGEGNLQVIIDWLKREVRKVDYVLLYDCMSLVEFLAISAYLQLKGMKSAFLSRAFLNPVGLTRFITQQLHEMQRHEVLREVARLIAESLGGIGWFKSSYPDKVVHKYGYLGIDEFVEAIDIKRIAEEVWEQATRGKLLVGTDHGYDVIRVLSDDYIYVTHGFKPRDTYKSTPLLLLSRFALFMEVYGRW